jgi:SAM-dependent methyltransferase
VSEPFANLDALACRSCAKTGLRPVLSLGETPLANSLLTREQLGQPEPRFPLEVAFCPYCTLVQLTESVPPESMFRDYVYFSSFSDTMLKHAEALAERYTTGHKLGANSLVVEVASNDGYLLQYYKQRGVPVLGIEPARNIAKVAEERGIPTRCEFFGLDLARQLVAEGIQADIIHANNVLAHVPDLNGFVAGLRELLKPNGKVVVELPHLLPMIDRVEFDTIYHEHLCYFSLVALHDLFSRNGLSITNVTSLRIHGGSIHISAVRSDQFEEERPDARLSYGRYPKVAELATREREWGVFSAQRYEQFRQDVECVTQTLRSTLLDLKRQGRRIAVYGASAKGSTLLNYLKLPPGVLEWVADRSTVKQGRFTPGTHLEIVPPERLLQDQPDDVLLLVWNFADEVLAQQAEYRQRGGRFIIPLPQVRFV